MPEKIANKTQLRYLVEAAVLKKCTDEGRAITSDELRDEVARCGIVAPSKPTEDIRAINALWRESATVRDPHGKQLVSFAVADKNLIEGGAGAYYLNDEALSIEGVACGRTWLAVVVEELCKKHLPVSFFYTKVIYDRESRHLARVPSSAEPVQVYPLRVVASDAREYLLAFSSYWYLRDSAANGEAYAKGEHAKMTKKPELWGVVPYRVDRIDMSTLKLPGENDWFAPQENDVYEGRFFDALSFDNEDKLEEMETLCEHIKSKYPDVFDALCHYPYEILPEAFAVQWADEAEEALRDAINMANSAVDFAGLIGLDTMFGMYASPISPAIMYIRDTAFNGFFDRFGGQVGGRALEELDEDEVVEEAIWRGGERDVGHVWVRAEVVVSPGASFYGWLLQFDGQIVLAESEFMADFKRYLDQMRKAYGE